MPLETNGDVPLPEGWELASDYDGKPFFIDHNTHQTTWIDPRDRLNKPHTFADCVGDELPLGWEETFDGDVGVYYINHLQRQTQVEDPRYQWRSHQERMLKDYLVTANENLEAKKEICTVKEQRLRLAQDEFQHLNESVTGWKSSTSLHSSSSSSSTKYDPDLLRADVALARNRVNRLRLELEQVNAEVDYKERGVEALTKVGQKMCTGYAVNDYSASEQRLILDKIRTIQQSLSLGQKERDNLLQSLAQLKDEILLNRVQTGSSPDVSTLNLPHERFSTASQTDLTGEGVSTGARLAEIARMRLQYDEAKKRVNSLSQELAAVMERDVPGQNECDKDRLLLIQEKEQLLRELRSMNQNGRSRTDIASIQAQCAHLEHGINAAMAASSQQIAQRLKLQEHKALTKRKLDEAVRLTTYLESQLKSVSLSTLSSGSSIGSLGSLSASSRTSLTSLSFSDIYGQARSLDTNVQDLNRIYHVLHGHSISTIHEGQDCQFEAGGHSPARVPLAGQSANQFEASAGSCVTSEQQQPIGYDLGPPPSYEQHMSRSYSGMLPQIAENIPCNDVQTPALSQAHGQTLSQAYGQTHGQTHGQAYDQAWSQAGERFHRASITTNLPQFLDHHLHAAMFSSSQSLPQISSAGASACARGSTQSLPHILENSRPSCAPAIYQTELPRVRVMEGSIIQKLTESANLDAQLFSEFNQRRMDDATSFAENEALPAHAQYDYDVPFRNYDAEWTGVEDARQFNNEDEDTNLTGLLLTNYVPVLTEDENHVPMLHYIDPRTGEVVQTHYLNAELEVVQAFPQRSHDEEKLDPAGQCCGGGGGGGVEPGLPPLSPISETSSGMGNCGNMSGANTRSVSAAVSDESVAGDSGVFEASGKKTEDLDDPRPKTVECAQILLKLRYERAAETLCISVEEARNLLALFPEDGSQICVKVSLLPCPPGLNHQFTTSCSRNLSSPKFCETYRFLISEAHLYTKTLQTNVWCLLHDASDECLGSVQVSLADFDGDKVLHKWYNVLSFKFMQAGAGKKRVNSSDQYAESLQVASESHSSRLSPCRDQERPSSASSSSDDRSRRGSRMSNPAVTSLREESSDESTIISSQTSTLTRNKGADDFCGFPSDNDDESVHTDTAEDESTSTSESEDKGATDESIIRKTAKADNNNRQGSVERLSAALKSTDINENESVDDNAVSSSDTSGSESELEEVHVCNKETNTESAFRHRPTTGNAMQASVRRSQTFSPAALRPDTRRCKLNRHDSDSAVPLHRRGPFQRNTVERRTLRRKKSSCSLQLPPSAETCTNMRTDLDLELDLQASQTRLEQLTDEVSRLRRLVTWLEEARRKGDGELPVWFTDNEQLQKLMAQAEILCKKQEVTQPSVYERKVDKLLRKVNKEVGRLNNNNKKEERSFREKMAFFTTINMSVPVIPSDLDCTRPDDHG